MIAILTDFSHHDPAYSLCGVVDAQLKALRAHGITPLLVARGNYQHPDHAHVAYLDPGEIDNNVVNLTTRSDDEIKNLVAQMANVFGNIEVILCHDVIYQPNLWKYHIALRLYCDTLEQPPVLVHWAHSASMMDVAKQTGGYYPLLAQWPRNAYLVAFSHDEVERKRVMFDCPADRVVVLANGIDFSKYFHPLTELIISKAKLWHQDLIAIYPCRLDRGKQPHIAAEIVSQIVASGVKATLLLVDYHSISGDKLTYREEIKEAYGRVVQFTSELDGRLAYEVPGQVLRELFLLSDFLIHPSMSEGDPLVVQEAAFAGCGLVLNYDLPPFRAHQGTAIMGRFSSAINAATGMLGQTVTEYHDREAYMAYIGRQMVHQLNSNPIAKARALARKTRNPLVSGYTLLATLEALRCLTI